MQTSCLRLAILLSLLPNSNSFTPFNAIRSSHVVHFYREYHGQSKTRSLGVSIMPDGAWHQDIQQNDDKLQNFKHDSNSYYLSKDEARPLIRIGKDDNEKIINKYGIWCAVVSILTGPFWMMAMSILNFMNHQKLFANIDPHRSIYDKTGKIWSKVWLSMIGSYPTLTGNVNAIKKTSNNGACLYVANHASWMDIPVLCTVLDPVFKFIAKGELRKVPCIGQQLDGGSHILIDREDRKSQLRTFKDGMAWLNKGVPLMAFPEGMRSKDGRLMEFKKGLFSMAVKANVPIVPITISHTHAIMPGYCILPIQPGRNKVHIHINEPISPTGKTEAELEQLVRTVFLNTLPECQLPVLVGATSTPLLLEHVSKQSATAKVTSSIMKDPTTNIKIIQETNNNKNEIKVSS